MPIRVGDKQSGWRAALHVPATRKMKYCQEYDYPHHSDSTEVCIKCGCRELLPTSSEWTAANLPATEEERRELALVRPSVWLGLVVRLCFWTSLIGFVSWFMPDISNVPLASLTLRQIGWSILGILAICVAGNRLLVWPSLYGEEREIYTGWFAGGVLVLLIGALVMLYKR